MVCINMYDCVVYIVLFFLSLYISLSLGCLYIKQVYVLGIGIAWPSIADFRNPCEASFKKSTKITTQFKPSPSPVFRALWR